MLQPEVLSTKKNAPKRKFSLIFVISGQKIGQKEFNFD